MTHPRMEQIQALWDKHVYFAEREEKMADVFCPKPQPYRPFRWRLDGKAPIVVDKKGRKIK